MSKEDWQAAQRNATHPATEVRQEPEVRARFVRAVAAGAQDFHDNAELQEARARHAATEQRLADATEQRAAHQGPSAEMGGAPLADSATASAGSTITRCEAIRTRRTRVELDQRVATARRDRAASEAHLREIETRSLERLHTRARNAVVGINLYIDALNVLRAYEGHELHPHLDEGAADDIVRSAIRPVTVHPT